MNENPFYDESRAAPRIRGRNTWGREADTVMLDALVDEEGVSFDNEPVRGEREERQVSLNPLVVGGCR